VHGLQRGADIAGGEIAEQEFNTVRQLRRDDVALLQPERTETCGKRERLGVQIAIRDRLRSGDGGLAAAPADEIA
jgi:hypothetical protein